jgi:hypothetical protein
MPQRVGASQRSSTYQNPGALRVCEGAISDQDSPSSMPSLLTGEGDGGYPRLMSKLLTLGTR